MAWKRGFLLVELIVILMREGLYMDISHTWQYNTGKEYRHKSQKFGFTTCACYFLFVASCLASLSLSFCIYKIGMYLRSHCKG